MTTAVREKPILFSGPMVRAILDGRKTQTRRVVKLTAMPGEGNPARCPFGEVGDRLWVREGVIQVGHERTGRNGQYLWPKFDDEAKARRWFDSCCEYTVDLKGPNDPTYIEPHGTLNKLFMPRWASRITLEVTGVRVERLNEISEADAEAEGIQSQNFTGWGDEPGLPHFPEPTVYRDYSSNHRLGCDWLESPVESFRTLWDSINGKSHPWASNPWVWVVEFRRVEEAK